MAMRSITIGVDVMHVPDVAQAEVVTETGARFIAEVANLASTGLFLKTREPLYFRQRLSIRLLGVSVRGEVLYVASAPDGAVIGLRTSPNALAKLEAHREAFEVIPIPGRDEATEQPFEEFADPWAEDTATASQEGDEPQTQELAVDIRVAHASKPRDLPIDPALIAAAIIDDAPDVTDEPEPTRQDLQAYTDDGVGTLPAIELGQNDRHLTLVGLDEAETTTDDAELPLLESDGFTVSFTSAGAYRFQYQSHIRHGGLVLQALPLPVGTQRMLSLAVPNVGTYTVSARVIFHTKGKLGFMLDSFGVHRERLAAMAKAS